MRKFTNNYPEVVQEFCNKVLLVLDHIKFYQRTFEPNLSADEEQICFDILCKDRLQNFLKGEELEFKSDTESTEIINLSVATIILYRLKDKGYIDCVEDEKGNEIFFLTAKGKDIVEGSRIDKEKTYIVPK